MARLIGKQMAENGIYTDGLFFILGNLAPDMTLSYVYRRHTREISLPHLEKQIRFLYKKGVDPYGAAFSWHLGVMSHYVCDFLCYPHTPAYNGGTAGHFFHEVRQTAKASDILPFDKQKSRGLDAARLTAALDRHIERRERLLSQNGNQEYEEVSIAMYVAAWASSCAYLYVLQKSADRYQIRLKPQKTLSFKHMVSS
jgi:hypothetical protein